MKQLLCKCDICKSDMPTPKADRPIWVVFTTEQTEGRPVKPHLSLEKPDICDTCYAKMIENMPIWGSGAMGSNTYWWNKKIDELETELREAKKRAWFEDFRPIINAIGEISVQEAMDAIERTLAR